LGVSLLSSVKHGARTSVSPSDVDEHGSFAGNGWFRAGRRLRYGVCCFMFEPVNRLLSLGVRRVALECKQVPRPGLGPQAKPERSLGDGSQYLDILPPL